MTTNLQVCLDCADPHRMADFWAAALGCTVERDPDAIRGLLEAGACTEDDVMTLDGDLVWKTGAAMNDPSGRLPRWFFQLVEEAKVVKNRMHVDIQVGETGRTEVIERLTDLGATSLYEGRQGPHTWLTMADPEGNEFCVS